MFLVVSYGSRDPDAPQEAQEPQPQQLLYSIAVAVVLAFLVVLSGSRDPDALQEPQELQPQQMQLPMIKTCALRRAQVLIDQNMRASTRAFFVIIFVVVFLLLADADVLIR